LTDPKKDMDSQEALPIAPLPQKNAVSPPCGGMAKHEENLLDEALESTFPASDPVTETQPKIASEREVILQAEEEVIQHEEFLLDEALELTFPASDPIAIPDFETIAKTAACHPRH
jgi:hypothetical protein